MGKIQDAANLAELQAIKELREVAYRSGNRAVSEIDNAIHTLLSVHAKIEDEGDAAVFASASSEFVTNAITQISGFTQAKKDMLKPLLDSIIAGVTW